jgi:hypothetical protein
MSMPSPAPAKTTLLGTPAIKPSAFEPSRPLKRAEVAKPIAKTKPAEAAVEAGAAAREPKTEAGEPAKAVEASAKWRVKPATLTVYVSRSSM